MSLLIFCCCSKEKSLKQRLQSFFASVFNNERIENGSGKLLTGKENRQFSFAVIDTQIMGSFRVEFETDRVGGELNALFLSKVRAEKFRPAQMGNETRSRFRTFQNSSPSIQAASSSRVFRICFRIFFSPTKYFFHHSLLHDFLSRFALAVNLFSFSQLKIYSMY